FDMQRHLVERQLRLLHLPPGHQSIRAACLAKTLRDAVHLDRCRIQFACVDRHDLNSSMNCAEQQKTVGLRATRSKAFVSRSKLLGFQCCEARAGQAPPLKVASVPVRKRCLIAFVQYASSQAKSTRPCVKALVAAVDYDVRATGRVVCSHIGFLFGHPDRFPFPAECLTSRSTPRRKRSSREHSTQITRSQTCPSSRRDDEIPSTTTVPPAGTCCH